VEPEDPLPCSQQAVVRHCIPKPSFTS